MSIPVRHSGDPAPIPAIIDAFGIQVPFAFTGMLEKITFDLGEASMTPEFIKTMMEKRDR